MGKAKLSIVFHHTGIHTLHTHIHKDNGFINSFFFLNSVNPNFDVFFYYQSMATVTKHFSFLLNLRTYIYTQSNTKRMSVRGDEEVCGDHAAYLHDIIWNHGGSVLIQDNIHIRREDYWIRLDELMEHRLVTKSQAHKQVKIIGKY